MLCKGEEQRTAPGGAGPPRKADFPHLTLSPPTDPTHTPAKKSLQCFCSFLGCFFFFFRVLFQNRLILRSCGLWGPRQPPSLGPLTLNPGSLSEPELDLKVEESGLRDSDIRSLSVMFHEGDEEAGVLGS